MPVKFVDLDTDCKLELLKHCDSFHDLQVLIEAYPRLYPLLRANVLGVYRHILANSFQLDPWDLVYEAAGRPQILEDFSEWKQRRDRYRLRYAWESFIRELPSDGNDVRTWLCENSDLDYEYKPEGGVEPDETEEEEIVSAEEDAAPGRMSNPEGEDESFNEESDSEQDNGERTLTMGGGQAQVGGHGNSSSLVENMAPAGSSNTQQQQQQQGHATDGQIANNHLTELEMFSNVAQPLPESDSEDRMVQEPSSSNKGKQKTVSSSKRQKDDILDDADDECDANEGHDDSKSNASSSSSAFWGYVPQGYQSIPPRFPIPKVKTSTMFELSRINFTPMRIFQIYRMYMLADPSANPGPREGLCRLRDASADELYRFKRGFLLFYIYRNMWRRIFDEDYKNDLLEKEKEKEMEKKLWGKFKPWKGMPLPPKLETSMEKEADDNPPNEKEPSDESLMHFMRNLSRRDLGYLSCVTSILISMARLLANQIFWKDNPYRLIDTLFESETASGYTSLTRVLDQFHNGREKKITKLLHGVGSYYDTLIEDLQSHIKKVWNEKNGTPEQLAKMEGEAIWDVGPNGESLWSELPPIKPTENWIGDLPAYFRNPEDMEVWDGRQRSDSSMREH